MEPSMETVTSDLDGIRAELVELEAVESPTEEQVARGETLLAEWDEKEAVRAELLAAEAKKVARAEKIEAIKRTALENPERIETGFGAPQVMVRRDAYENLDAVHRGMVPKSDLVARAQTAIEQGASDVSDHAKEAAAALANRPSIARHMLMTGSPEYRSAFEKILESPEHYQAFLSPGEAEALRTAMSTTVGNGGYAIPFLLDPSIILTSTGSQNPFRRISRIVKGVSNKWQGITSAGVSAQWLAENTAATDASPTIGQPSITAHKGAAWVFGSYEVFEDTNLASELPGMIMDAKDRLEASAFAIGSGSGAPYGVVPAVYATTASRVSPTTGGVFTTASRADIDAVVEALPDTHQDKASWVAHYKTYGIARRMDTSGGGSFWANLGAKQPEELLGLPTYRSVHMDSTCTTGSEILICGDFNNYVIYDRIGLSLEYIPNQFDGSGIPTLQRGWVAHWRTGADSVNDDAFRVLSL